MRNLKREYCCTECGLVWFNKELLVPAVTCPECNNHIGKNPEHSIYACDTFGWYYESKKAVKDLELRNKKIHYAKDHPWFNKNK